MGIQGCIKKLLSSTLTISMILCIMGVLSPVASAKETSQKLDGDYYEFSAKTAYTFTDLNSVVAVSKAPFGALSVLGNYKYSDNIFTVSDGVLSFEYAFNQSKLSSDANEWHIIEDSGKKIDSIDLGEKIKSGAIVVQTSLDNTHWVIDEVLTDVFTNETVLSKPFFFSKDIQQQNGCYYRIIVAYEMESLVGSNKVVFVNVDNKEQKRIAEVYEFYVIDNDTGKTTSAQDAPRRELGSKIETEKDHGFTGELEIDRKDPHYGWDLGVFTVNGYTRETKDDNGTPVFLKNVGDKVVLWFTLKQDINCLNNNSDLSIADDNGSYDQHFEIARTNFGQGTLIIQYTDYQGVKHDPIIYTNYLAANATTGADTKVQLFEEGDYEVSLDYEIKNSPRQIGSVSIVPTYTDYKITFSFSIRNGNCMVFPFDLGTGSELSEKAITENGFRLDMAMSRYLTIDVEHQTISINDDGTITTDTRFNRPAKDNDEYKNPGIYIFTVKNLYTGSSPTTKTIYVGSDKYLYALANTGLSIPELNSKILDGYTIVDDGTLTEPSIEETTDEAVVNQPTANSSDTVPTQDSSVQSQTVSPSESSKSVPDPQEQVQRTSSKIAIPIAIVAVLVVIAVYFFLKKSKAKVTAGVKEDDCE